MKDRPTEVRLGIYVNSFHSISEQTMDYSVSMYLRQEWRDPRLSFEPLPNKIVQFRLGEGSWTKIWIPDTFFRNEKRANFHEVTVENRLLRLNATGHLWYVTKISATLSCPMKLQKYPLDTQKCPMMFESFGYTMDTMYFSWLGNAVDVDKDLEMPQFSLVDQQKHDCSQNYTAGAFPCLSIEFVLHREIGFFIIQVYVPSMLIVILSWVSFWINIDASPARVSLGLLTVLATTTMSGGARESLPRVSYIKAIDVWMIVCLVFVFASLIEYAVVNVVSRRRIRTTTAAAAAAAALCAQSRGTGNHPKTDRVSKKVPSVVGRLLECTRNHRNADEGGGTESRSSSKTVDPEASKRRAQNLDKIARKFFPFSFVFFNIIYWISYSLPSQ